MTELLLFFAGLLGGAVNTLAGGGSFIVFPALLAVGVPPVLANASNTYAALPGYVSGAIGLWSHMMAQKRLFLPYGIVSALFGYAGAELLLRVSDAQFALVVPWLMLFAVVLFVFGGRINAFVAARAGTSRGAKAAGWLLLYAMLAGRASANGSSKVAESSGTSSSKSDAAIGVDSCVVPYRWATRAPHGRAA